MSKTGYFVDRSDDHRKWDDITSKELAEIRRCDPERYARLLAEHRAETVRRYAAENRQFDDFTASELRDMRENNPGKYWALFEGKYGQGSAEEFRTNPRSAATHGPQTLGKARRYATENRQFDDFTASELRDMRENSPEKYWALFEGKYGLGSAEEFGVKVRAAASRTASEPSGVSDGATGVRFFSELLEKLPPMSQMSDAPEVYRRAVEGLDLEQLARELNAESVANNMFVAIGGVAVALRVTEGHEKSIDGEFLAFLVKSAVAIGACYNRYYALKNSKR